MLIRGLADKRRSTSAECASRTYAATRIRDQIGNRSQDAVAVDAFEARFKIRPFDGLNSWRFRHNSGHNLVTLAEFDYFTGLKPG